MCKNKFQLSEICSILFWYHHHEYVFETYVTSVLHATSNNALSSWYPEIGWGGVDNHFGHGFQRWTHIFSKYFLTKVHLIHKPGPQSRALCDAVCALSIGIVVY